MLLFLVDFLVFIKISKEFAGVVCQEPVCAEFAAGDLLEREDEQPRSHPTQHKCRQLGLRFAVLAETRRSA